MKKLICGFLCAAVGVALADVESVVATIEVRAITSSLTNTIVAIPGLDLATGGDLAISNLVKTTNLAAGDKLVAFDGNTYETWVLSETGGKHWVKTEKKITITPRGTETPTTTDASQYTLPVGKGIWLSRTASGTASPFFVYAQQPTSTSTTVSAGATALVGNPTADDAAPTISDAQSGDQIIVPTATFLQYYTYNGTVWRYLDSDDTIKQGLPTIGAGLGFWYKAASGGSERTISW